MAIPVQFETCRLQSKAPHSPLQTLERRARKFADQIFPLFLTREAAMLKITAAVFRPPFLGYEEIAFPWDSAGKIACVTRLA